MRKKKNNNKEEVKWDQERKTHFVCLLENRLKGKLKIASYRPLYSLKYKAFAIIYIYIYIICLIAL